MINRQQTNLLESKPFIPTHMLLLADKPFFLHIKVNGDKIILNKDFTGRRLISNKEVKNGVLIELGEVGRLLYL